MEQIEKDHQREHLEKMFEGFKQAALKGMKDPKPKPVVCNDPFNVPIEWVNYSKELVNLKNG